MGALTLIATALLLHPVVGRGDDGEAIAAQLSVAVGDAVADGESDSRAATSAQVGLEEVDDTRLEQMQDSLVGALTAGEGVR